jgi:hypothetical protein
MADRTPMYELHIKPLFRLIDREHMALFFDLYDYDVVKQHANVILQRLRTSMPPASSGGPWPAELVTMFARWVTAGCPRLLVGQGSNYQLTKSGTSYHLEGTAEVPNDSAQAWLDIVDVTPANRTYKLYVDPGAGGQGAPASRIVFEDFEEASTLSAVQVIDAAGTHTVSLTVA